jgi:hypothetical protein
VWRLDKKLGGDGREGAKVTRSKPVSLRLHSHITLSLGCREPSATAAGPAATLGL